MLKKINPKTGKKKKRPKIKLSFVYKFFFFKNHLQGTCQFVSADDALSKNPETKIK